jgi:hypothetical protein
MNPFEATGIQGMLVARTDRLDVGSESGRL